MENIGEPKKLNLNILNSIGQNDIVKRQDTESAYLSIFNKINKNEDDELDSSELGIFVGQLKAIAGDDNELSEEEALAFLQQNGLNDITTNDLFNFINSLSGIKTTASKTNKQHFEDQNAIITYAKKGENFKQTAKRLGIKPGTEEYNQFMEANPTAANRSNGGWFKVGEKVVIPSALKEKINQDELLNYEQGREEVAKFASANKKPEIQPTPKKTEKTVQAKKVRYVSKTGRYTITQGGVRKYYSKNGTEITKESYINAENYDAPKNMQGVVRKLKEIYGGNPVLQWNYRTKSYDVLINNPKDKNISSIVINLSNQAWQKSLSKTDAIEKGFKDAWDTLKFRELNIEEAFNAGTKNNDSNITYNDYIKTVKINYKNGKVTKSTYENGKCKKTEELQSSTLKEPEKTSQEKANSALTDKTGEHITFAADISFTMPKDAPEDAKTFANCLCDNKARLMKQLGIDNDTYNMLAQTAIGIAGQETQFGTSSSVYQVGKNVVRELVNDSTVRARMENELDNIPEDELHSFSQGMTQIKFTEWIKDDIVRENLRALGITNQIQLQEPQVAALATMVVLARINQQIDSSEARQKGIKAAQGKTVVLEGYEMGTDGVARKTADGSTRPWTNNLTRQDVLCAFYNGGRSAAVINGNFDTSWTYSNNVRKYANQYKLVENTNSRAEAKLKSERVAAYENMDNNGPIGGVVFLPAMYTDKNKHLNSQDEINLLEQTLTTKGIREDLKTQLIDALRNGELSFDFGLTEAEMKAFTNADIELLLNYLNNLKNEVNADEAINTTDGITANEAQILRSKYSAIVSKAENDFRTNYLNNHSKVYDAREDNPKVLRATTTNRTNPNYVTSKGHRRGFRHEAPLPVNRNTTQGEISSQQYALANAAYSYVMANNPDNKKSGECLTGVKAAMTNAGIDVSGMAECGTVPKYAKNWFDKHPEMFTPVEYVSIGNGKARTINASDIKNLPAGYIVIFVPEESSSEAGHIEITNGNGQGYADATDNMEWNLYTSSKQSSGKGEHGKFYVYKLSDNWEVDANGKLKLRQ